MEEQSLYLDVKKTLCRMIFDDVYKDGELLPSERKLSEELSVSRVTVRKALKLLEEERIIDRVQGSGTRVAMQYGARKGNMDIVTLVAPAQNAFFSQVIDAVQTQAEQRDTLVLFKQKPENVSLEKCLYQIYDKDLRNVVLWLEDMEISAEALKKLRGLGMNLVLFDTTYENPYADAVCLDNQKAVKALVNRLRKEGCRKLGYVGWDEMRVGSVQVREQAFLSEISDGAVQRMSWKYRNALAEIPKTEIAEKLMQLADCDGIVYSVSELGIPFERMAKELGLVHASGMIDAVPSSEDLSVTAVVEQDFQQMAKQIFTCLEIQNQEGRVWDAAVYRISGICR